MPEYVTINIEKEDKLVLQETAKQVASKLGMKKLSLAQLIHMMHESYTV